MINKQFEASDICYPINYSRDLNHMGRYNFSLCGSLFSDFVEKQHIAQQILPVGNQQFIAYAGFYYTAHFFFESENTPTRNAYEDRVQSVCAMPWDQLKEAYPKIDTRYLSIYCANAAYFIELLYRGYGLQDGQVTIQNKIAQRDIDWTLGALLYRLSQQ